MEVGLVQKINIDDEMQQAYLDYAMSVIVSRALPDARDGLKPVHRRILYAMYDMGIRPESPFKKSARIVGEVLGKYHPHGDMAVYDAMARMAQDFSMRCVLVDGQGNFGSVDGDPPAAMRYTEARLAAPAMQMLADIGKNTVEFDPNFDETLNEPRVLPAAIPNLLVNGATGIAVGMSTSIPPHNLGEVVDALRHMLDKWEKLDDINLEDLMHFIQGPDFPTGGVIIQESGEEALMSAYGTGRGGVTLQARAHLEEMERGRNRIIVTELPYMTNKASLIERIAELVREERLVGIADLRDESDRQGMRIVIELTKTADPEALLQDLYKHTPMQSTFSIIMLALVEGEPRLLSLKQALRVYLDHRLEIIRRRSEYDLEKAKQRAHILEGLRVALKNLDEVIDMIRKAPDVDAARVRLMKRFRLSETQAQAILDMQLRRLAALERKKIELEYKEVQDLIKELSGLLRSHKKMRQMVSDELLAMKEAYGDRRRTHIVQLKDRSQKKTLLTVTDLAPDKFVWLLVTPDGLISRTHEDEMPRQSGVAAPAWLLRVNTRDTLYLVNEQGDTAALPVHAVPEAENGKGGVPLYKASALKAEDRLAALFTLPPKSERQDDLYVLTCTRQGMLKKSLLSELPGPSANTFTLVRVNEGDRLGWLRVTAGQSEVLLVTASGMAIRFSEEEVRPMGLVAAGVMGIKLQGGDEVVGIGILPQPGEVFLLATDGSGKRVALEQFPRQGRYGQGVVAWKLPSQVKVAGFTVGKGTSRATIFFSRLAPKVVRLDAAPLQGRAARGKVIQGLRSGDSVVGLSAAWEMQSPAAGLIEEITQLALGKKVGGDGVGRAPARKRTSSPGRPSSSPPVKAATVEKTSKPAKKAVAKVKTGSKATGSRKAEVRQPVSKATRPAKGMKQLQKASPAGKSAPRVAPAGKMTVVKKGSATQLVLSPALAEKPLKKAASNKSTSTSRTSAGAQRKTATQPLKKKVSKPAADARAAKKTVPPSKTPAKVSLSRTSTGSKTGPKSTPNATPKLADRKVSSPPTSARSKAGTKPTPKQIPKPAAGKTLAKKGSGGKSTPKGAPLKTPKKGSTPTRKTSR